MKEFFSSGTFFGAVIAVGSIIVNNVVNHFLSLHRERRRAEQARANLVLGKWLDKLLNFEERAGLLADRLSGYQPLENCTPTPQQIYLKLENERGLFWRYKNLRIAIDNFLIRAGIVISKWEKWGSGQERDNDVGEMLTAHEKLSQEIKKIKEGKQI